MPAQQRTVEPAKHARRIASLAANPDAPAKLLVGIVEIERSQRPDPAARTRAKSLDLRAVVNRRDRSAGAEILGKAARRAQLKLAAVIAAGDGDVAAVEQLVDVDRIVDLGAQRRTGGQRRSAALIAEIELRNAAAHPPGPALAFAQRTARGRAQLFARNRRSGVKRGEALADALSALARGKAAQVILILGAGVGLLALALAGQAKQLDRARSAGVFRQADGIGQQLHRAVDRVVTDCVLGIGDQRCGARRVGLAALLHERRGRRSSTGLCRTCGRRAGPGDADHHLLRLGPGGDFELTVFGEKQREHRAAGTVALVFDRAQFGHPGGRAQRIAALGAETGVKRSQPDVQFAALGRERTQHLNAQVEVDRHRRAIRPQVGADVGQCTITHGLAEGRFGQHQPRAERGGHGNQGSSGCCAIDGHVHSPVEILV